GDASDGRVGLLFVESGRSANVELSAPCPSILGPIAAFPISARTHEPGELARGHRRPVEPVRPELDLMLRALVVVRARRDAGTQQDAPAVELDPIGGTNAKRRRHAMEAVLEER